MPRRIQRRRDKGWKATEGAVYVGRPTRWGNPFRIGHAQLRFPRVDGRESWEYEGRLHKRSGERHPFNHTDGHSTWHDVRDATAAECVELYREWVTGETDMLGWQPTPQVAEISAELAGKDLMCWCAEGQPCHADVLIEIANEEAS